MAMVEAVMLLVHTEEMMITEKILQYIRLLPVVHV